MMDYEAIERERAQRIADVKAEVLRRLGRDLPPGVRVASWELVADGVIVHGDGFIDEYVLGLRAAIRAQEATEGMGSSPPFTVGDPVVDAAAGKVTVDVGLRSPFPAMAQLGPLGRLGRSHQDKLIHNPDPFPVQAPRSAALDIFRAWLAAHCCCCGAERPVGKWEAAEWTELIMVLPERANNPAWQCPTCWRHTADLATRSVLRGDAG